MTMKEHLRILLVDDHEVVRLGLRSLLARLPGFDVVAEAATESEAVTALDQYLSHMQMLGRVQPPPAAARARRAPEARGLRTLNEADSLALLSRYGVPVMRHRLCRTPDEAVQLANHTRYGLAASVWSETIGLALHVAARLHAGVVWVNATNLFDAAAGFGGKKESGFGRAGGKEGAYEYLKPKAWSKAKPRIDYTVNINSVLLVLQIVGILIYAGVQWRSGGAIGELNTAAITRLETTVAGHAGELRALRSQDSALATVKADVENIKGSIIRIERGASSTSRSTRQACSAP